METKYDVSVEYIEVGREPKLYLWNHTDGHRVASRTTTLVASVVNFTPKEAFLNGRSMLIHPITINKVTENLLLNSRVDPKEQYFEIKAVDAQGNIVRKQFSLHYKPYTFSLTEGQDFNANFVEEIVTFNEPKLVWNTDVKGDSDSNTNIKTSVSMTDTQRNEDGIYVGKLNLKVETKTGGANVGSTTLVNDLNLSSSLFGWFENKRYFDVFTDVITDEQQTPEIEVLSPNDNSTTFFDRILVKVNIENDKLAKVRINQQEAEVNLTVYRPIYHYLEIPLLIGENTIVIDAKATHNDKVASKVIKVIRKEMPLPVFNVETPEQNKIFKLFNDDVKTVQVKGRIDLSIPLDELRVNGEIVSVNSGEFWYISDYELGQHKLIIEAFNAKGKTVKVVNFSIVHASPSIEVTRPVRNQFDTTQDIIRFIGQVDDKKSLLTINGNVISVDVEDGRFDYEYNLNEGLNTIEIIATNRYGETNKSFFVNRIIAPTSHIEIASGSQGSGEWNLNTSHTVTSQLASYRSSIISALPAGIDISFSFNRMSGTPTDTVVFNYNVDIAQSVTDGIYIAKALIDLLDADGNVINTGFLDFWILLFMLGSHD